jgi:acetolactate synthase-1/2/3 large subunit
VPTCAEVLARTLTDAGVTRMFGLPGGEMLDFLEAARRAGIRFILTRHEATAAFMADVTGQIQRRPGVCVATLGPGAVNMTLGVANAYLDRSPVVAITASLARASAPYATHQQLDLNAVYRPFTKQAITLDGEDTEGKVREPCGSRARYGWVPSTSRCPAMSRAARIGRRPVRHPSPAEPPPIAPASPDAIERVAAALAAARRPIVILGLDLDPRADADAVRAFVKHIGAPTFVTPKAKGLLPEDHPLFGGVCAGVAGDRVVLDLFARADLLVGVGFEPVESDKLWHHTMPLVSVGPVSIAAGDFRPQAEAVGDVASTLAELGRGPHVPHAWEPGTLARFRADLEAVLRPASKPNGLSAYELTRALRALFPRDTILATDVGSIKSITSQAWAAYEPLTFFESNGLSAMSYSFPAADGRPPRVPRSARSCAPSATGASA